MIFGLDMALVTGFALLEDNSPPIYGTWRNYAPGEGTRSEDRSRREEIRFGTFRATLGRQLDNHPRIEKVAYEMVWSHRGTAQAQLYGGWRAVVLATCNERGLQSWPVAWSTLKSVACGGVTPPAVAAIDRKRRRERRIAWKAAVVDAAQRRWGLPESLTDDEADALWVAEACRLGRGGGPR